MSSPRPSIVIIWLTTLATLILLLTLYRQYNLQFSVGVISNHTYEAGNEINPDLVLAEKLWLQSLDDRTRMLSESFNKDPSKRIQDFIYPYNIWDIFRPTFFCPFDLERIGRLGDGGKWVCGMSRYEILTPGPSTQGSTDKSMVVYSFGVEHDSSFEAALLRRLNVEIWGFDYSVDGWAKEVPSNSRTHFTKAAISGKTDRDQSPPQLAVRDIMADNGHHFVNLMKMDIEGAEFQALSALMDSAQEMGQHVLPIGQLLIELHITSRDDCPQTARELVEWFQRLESFGMRPVFNEHNWIGDVGSGHPQFIEVRLMPKSLSKSSEKQVLTRLHSTRLSTLNITNSGAFKPAWRANV